MKNRKPLTLILVGIALLGLCACGAFVMLFVITDSDTTTTETAERIAEVTPVLEEEPAEAEVETEVTPADSGVSADTATEPTAELAVEPAPTEEPAGAPEPTPTSEPLPTPQLEPGTSRSNPLTMADVLEAPNWTIEVMEFLRGEEAWDMAQTFSDFNDPPPSGMQYVLVRLKVSSTHSDSESHNIGSSDFGLTGEQLILYDRASMALPNVELNAELFAGGEAEGWLAFTVGQKEGQLMLLFDERSDFKSSEYHVVALDDNASITVDPSLFDIHPTDLGITRANPVPPGSSAVTEDWEITNTEVLRGDDAWGIIQAANQFNEHPPEGMEYIAVKFSVRNIGITDMPISISSSEFRLTGEHNLIFGRPSLGLPEPTLNVDLFPGGTFEGWTVMMAHEGEQQLMVRFEPPFDLMERSVRYLALAEGTLIKTPPGLADIEPNGLGKDRANPAPFGETIITEDWEVTVVKVVRGDEALVMVREADEVNDSPLPGTEYIAAKFRVRNISTDDEPEYMSRGSFGLVDESNVEQDSPFIIGLEQELDIYLYPGGVYEGWVVLQTSEGSANPVAVFSPPFSFSEYYLSLIP